MDIDKIDFGNDRLLRAWCVEKAMSYPQLYRATTAVEIAQKIYELISTGEISGLVRDVSDGDKAGLGEG